MMVPDYAMIGCLSAWGGGRGGGGGELRLLSLLSLLLFLFLSLLPFVLFLASCCCLTSSSPRRDQLLRVWLRKGAASGKENGSDLGVSFSSPVLNPFHLSRHRTTCLAWIVQV